MNNGKNLDGIFNIAEGGCSVKLAPKDLEKVTEYISAYTHPALYLGAQDHDDGAIIRTPGGELLVQTLDFFTPVVPDPYDFGQIAAANAISDIYAMGGEPLSALAIVGFPKAKYDLELLCQMLKGGADKVKEAGAALGGGHTIESQIPKYGFSVTGIVKEEEILANSNAQPGDILILTKPLGCGVIMAAYRNGLLDDLESPESPFIQVVESMKSLNKNASLMARKWGIKCATDITGFGLGGHALKMAKASNCTLNIESERLPAFTMVRELAQEDCITGASMRNLDFIKDMTEFSPEVKKENRALLLDPQTSGGLLLACASEKKDGLMADLEKNGVPGYIIGQAQEFKGHYLSIS